MGVTVILRRPGRASRRPCHSRRQQVRTPKGKLSGSRETAGPVFAPCTAKDIEDRSGRQSRCEGSTLIPVKSTAREPVSPNKRGPLLQVEDIRAATDGETALLESRDLGFFTVNVPNFWLATRDARRSPRRAAQTR
jgi:hypothetical protein